MAKRWRTDKASETESPRRGQKWKKNKGANKTILRRRTTRYSINVSENSPQSDDVELTSPPTRGSVHNVTNALPTPPNHLWTSRSSDTTCLSFGLDPSVDAHKKITCDKCLCYYDVVLHNNLSNQNNKVRSQAAKKYECTKPWSTVYATHLQSGKRNIMHDFHSMFGKVYDDDLKTIVDIPDEDTTEADIIAPTPRRPVVENVDAAITMNTPPAQEEAINNATPPAVTPPTTDDGGEPDGGEPESEEAPTDVTALLFGDNYVMKECITQNIMEAFSLRDINEHPLKEHELALLQMLVLNGDSIREDITSIIEPCLTTKVENHATLKPNEKRLLGQLAYAQFKREKRITLPSFAHYTPFDIVQVPTTKGVKGGVDVWPICVRGKAFRTIKSDNTTFK